MIERKTLIPSSVYAHAPRDKLAQNPYSDRIARENWARSSGQSHRKFMSFIFKKFFFLATFCTVLTSTAAVAEPAVETELPDVAVMGEIVAPLMQPSSLFIDKAGFDELDIKRALEEAFGPYMFTPCGNPAAVHMVLSSDRNHVITRGVKLRYLVNDEGALAQVRGCLNDIGTAMPSVVGNWRKNIAAQRADEFSFMPILSPLNTSSVAFDVRFAVANTYRGLIATLLFPGFIPQFAKSIERSVQTISATGNTELTVGNVLKKVPQNFYISEMPADFVRFTADMSTVGFVYWNFLSAVTIFDFGANLYQLERAGRTVHDQMRDVARMVRVATELGYLIRDTPELADGEYGYLVEFAERRNLSRGMHNLIDMLESRRFNAEANHLYSRGAAFAAWHLMQQVKDEFAPLFAAIGYVDTYCAMARAYLLQKDHNAQYCFPEIIEGSKPALVLDGFWHPRLNPSEAVVNSIALGNGNGPRSTLFTGPNWSGKSCAVRALATAAVFATLGIVPARHAMISIFDSVVVYLNPQESIEKGQSSFSAKLARLTAVENAIKNAPRDHKLLVVMDEPLHGTVEAEGQQLVEDFMTWVSQFENCSVHIATHFKSPAYLASTRGIFANYHLEILDGTTPGEFTRTFVMLDGPADWWFNDADRRKRYIQWIKNNNLDA